MTRLVTTARIAFSMTSLSLCLLLVAHSLGFLTDPRPAVLRGRSALCETIAIPCSLMAEQGNFEDIKRFLADVNHRRPDIRSITLRTDYGDIGVDEGDTANSEQGTEHRKSDEGVMRVPIFSQGENWGTVDVRFEPLHPPGWAGWLQHPAFRLSLFLLPATAFSFYAYLGIVLRQLNPSRVIPGRVRSALDTLAEGLLILDMKGHIVMANQSFGDILRTTPDTLIGQLASNLPWARHGGAATDDVEDEGDGDTYQPWVLTIQDGKPRTGRLINFELPDGTLTFFVNVSPIRDGNSRHRGVLASFENVTSLEKKKAELSHALTELSKHSDEIRRQNQELELLATLDPLTSCLNRRSFFDRFEKAWKRAYHEDRKLACVMVDVDHFKSINDTHGHQAGDKVLREVSRVLRSNTPAGQLMCRYGGEEFVVLLTETDLADAAEVGDRLRAAVAAASPAGVSATVSVGVSGLGFGGNPMELLEQADQCLYVAKRTGRNRVVRWDEVPDTDLNGDEQAEEEDSASASPPRSAIPYEAVSALMSSLAYRDLETAEHSRRVADLCVAMAEGITSLADCHVLENAALLHDIGKVGVPDTILLKPGPLTEEEMQLMRRHSRIGVEIVRSSFGSEKLAEIIECARAHYEGTPGDDSLPRGRRIPLGARILAIADAYDSMVSEKVYRHKLTPAKALAEIQRCAGTQFDPELVERFADCVAFLPQWRETSGPEIPRESALSIGRQIERLVGMLDRQDMHGLKSLAERLRLSASRRGVNDVADKAAELEGEVENDESLVHVLKTANELIDLCRLTQRSFLHSFRQTSSAKTATGSPAPDAATDENSPAAPPNPAVISIATDSTVADTQTA